jgi:uncharacterized protein
MVSDPDRIDALARELHEELFSRIDCTRCANCCKTIQPGFTDEDIARIAAHLGMSEETFIGAYLEIDPEEGDHKTKAAPCPFLGGDDRCTIYEVRPLGCQEFPHTDKEGFTRRVNPPTRRNSTRSSRTPGPNGRMNHESVIGTESRNLT